MRARWELESTAWNTCEASLSQCVVAIFGHAYRMSFVMVLAEGHESWILRRVGWMAVPSQAGARHTEAIPPT